MIHYKFNTSDQIGQWEEQTLEGSSQHLHLDVRCVELDHGCRAHWNRTALPMAKEHLMEGLQLSGGENKGGGRTRLHSEQSMAVSMRTAVGQEGC